MATSFPAATGQTPRRSTRRATVISARSHEAVRVVLGSHRAALLPTEREPRCAGQAGSRRAFPAPDIRHRSTSSADAIDATHAQARKARETANARKVLACPCRRCLPRAFRAAAKAVARSAPFPASSAPAHPDGRSTGVFMYPHSTCDKPASRRPGMRFDGQASAASSASRSVQGDKP